MTENKDEINPQLVNQITEDFNRVYKNLYYASKQIIKKGFSEYPIFIMTKENTDIGSLLIDINEIIIPLMIAAKIIAIVTSDADKGAPIISTILPITFPIKSDDEECEKACCITCIAIKPGAKNSIKLTPKTPSLLSPIARDITSKNNIAVIIGPTTVCPKTFRNLNVSFLYNEYVPIQLKLNLLTPILYLLFNSTISTCYNYFF